MLPFIFGKAPILQELAIRVTFYGQDDDPAPAIRSSKIPNLIILHVSSSSTIKDVLDRVVGKYSMPYECHFLFHGKILKFDSKVPTECFESYNQVDEDSESFRSRIVLCVNLAQPQLKRHDGITKQLKTNTTQRHGNEALDEVAAEHEDSEWQADKKLLIEEHFQAAQSKTVFDLEKELQKIGCQQFCDFLVNAGFSSEGAFASLNSSDFDKNGLWIPMRARSRILALSESVRAKLCYETVTIPKSAKSKQISLEIREKINQATRQCIAAEEFDFMYGSVQESISNVCCEKHGQIVEKRKFHLIKLGTLRFEAHVASFLSWIPDNGEDLALFGNMFHGVLEILKSKGWVDIDVEKFRDVLWAGSTVTLNELNTREFCGHNDVFSTSNFHMHSKSKFIYTAKEYILHNNRNFFLTYN